MLTLARSLYEKIIIITASGEKVEVQVCEIRRGVVKIGFNADRSAQIDREEIYLARVEDR